MMRCCSLFILASLCIFVLTNLCWAVGVWRREAVWSSSVVFDWAGSFFYFFCIQRASCPWLCSRFCCFWPPINRGGLRRIPKRSCCLYAPCFSSIYLGSRGVFGLAWSLNTKPKWKPVWCGLLAQGFPVKLAGLLFSLRRIIIFILQLPISCHHTGRCVVFVSFML